MKRSPKKAMVVIEDNERFDWKLRVEAKARTAAAERERLLK
jgi:hypothetical protein